jgi:hypothetical protein
VVQALRLARWTRVKLNAPRRVAGGEQIPAPSRRDHFRAVRIAAPQAQAAPAQRAVGRRPFDVADDVGVTQRPANGGGPVEDLVVERVGLEVLAVHGPVQVGHEGGVAHAATQAVVLPVVLLHLKTGRNRDIVEITHESLLFSVGQGIF